MIRTVFVVLDMVGVVSFSVIFLICLIMKFSGRSATTESYTDDEHIFLNTMLFLTGTAVVVLLILGLSPWSPLLWP